MVFKGFAWEYGAFYDQLYTEKTIDGPEKDQVTRKCNGQIDCV
jgi:hypothetical protein